MTRAEHEIRRRILTHIMTYDEQIKANRLAVIAFTTWLLDQADNGVALGSFEDLQATFIAGQMAEPGVRRVALRTVKPELRHVVDASGEFCSSCGQDACTCQACGTRVCGTEATWWSLGTRSGNICLGCLRIKNGTKPA